MGSRNTSKEHISICICTYKRPQLLKNLLKHISQQETDGLFTLSASIVDNDLELSAKPIVEEFIKTNELSIEYAQVPERNLAILRNMSVNNSRGDYVAFIDDDEYPIDTWLLLLYKTVQKYKVAGALGPVIPKYQIEPPKWIIKGNFCERVRLTTGSFLQWGHTRTGNALLRREIFLDSENKFDIKFSLGGEDVTLFEKLIDKGYEFVWSDEAIVYEVVPVERMNASYFIKRSRLNGFMAYYYYKDTRPRIKNLMVFFKSLIAASIYLILFPVSLVRGYHHNVNLRIRIAHHMAVISTYLGRLNIEERNI